ncbi:MAG: hypothetical protein JO255_17275 [Alphaproteobacteria bacterium]|nr:hypothetical protein [Alphaproteobacteria bacterium]
MRSERPFNARRAVATLASLSDTGKVQFWCVLAHNLTVVVREFVYDEALTGSNLAKIRKINEMLHHVTDCISPAKRRSTQPWDDVSLLRALHEDAAAAGLAEQFGHAVSMAERSAPSMEDYGEAARAPMRGLSEADKE